MELRKFIKTTIREYMNEQKLFENSKLYQLPCQNRKNGFPYTTLFFLCIS
jgi:hypothetical protein